MSAGLPSILDDLPSNYRTKEGGFTAALIQALDEQIAEIENYTTFGANQLFLNTATGQFLVYLASKKGFTLPSGFNVDAETFRRLVPVMTSAPKQIVNTINELIATLYGVQAVSATMKSSVPEPYILVDGDYLIVNTDAGTSTVSIAINAFNDANNITAQELSTYLNSSQSLYFASVYTDITTNLNFLQLSSDGFGVNDWVVCSGGTAQNVLKFPNLANVNLQFEMSFAVSKPAVYSDLVTLTWNHTGTDPQFYNVSVGDIITLRNLSDVSSSGTTEIPVVDNFGHQVVDSFGDIVTVSISAQEGNYSALNGSTEVVDAGYDYVTFRNRYFNFDSGLLYILDPSTMTFTTTVKHRVYEESTFAYQVQTTPTETRVVVSAVSPEIQREFIGAAHLKGQDFNVSTFTHDSLVIEGSVFPPTPNEFVLFNDTLAYDFVPLTYKITGSTAPGVYTVSSDPTTSSVLPYTTSQNVGITDPFFMPFNSQFLTVKFGFPHGLKTGWFVTLLGSGANPSTTSITTSVLNTERPVYQVVDNRTIILQLPVFNTGSMIVLPNINQLTMSDAQGSDFYIQYDSEAHADAANIEVGQPLVIRAGATPVYSGSVYTSLINKTCLVTRQDGPVIYLKTGVGIGSVGIVAGNVPATRTTSKWGGSSVSYLLSTSTLSGNSRVLFDGTLTASFIDPVIESSFPGSYIFDTSGDTQYVIGKQQTNTTTLVKAGSYTSTLTVVDTTDFPQSGYLFLDFGNNLADGPIQYFNKSATQIFISPSYQFKNTHLAGANILYVASVQPPVLLTNGGDYQAFITGSTDYKDLLFILIRKLLAAGVVLDTDVIQPDLKYEDPSLDIYA